MVIRAFRSLAVLLCLAAFGSPAVAACSRLLPADAPGGHPSTKLTAKNLIELREIGHGSISFTGPSPLAVSPDGAKVAYVLTRADLATNGYCRALVVSSTRSPGPPTVLDRGGERPLIEEVDRGFYLPSGYPEMITPVWSPGGGRIAYRRQDGGVVRAWVVDARGGNAHPVSAPGRNVVTIAWSADGRRLIYAVRQGIAAQRRAIEEEGKQGWLYDERVNPDISPRPSISATDALDIFAVDLTSGNVEPADSVDRTRLKVPGLPGYPVDPAATAPDGQRAWVERHAPSPLAPATLMETDRRGRTIACTQVSCSGGIVSLWWQNGSVLFLRREGWNDETLALYRWGVDAATPVAVLRTEDVLRGCVMAAATLICTRETSTRPRRLVSVDTRTGAIRTLFNPNPGFDRVKLGSVQRLRWRNSIGLETWGDLVLSPDRSPGERLPLIVVQYHSLGFLRGGTGDEYPIFLMAQRGFAVLSLERPTFAAAADPTLKDWTAINAANQKNWAERKSLLSAVLVGVSKAVATGSIDPKRIGITGLSDGSATVAFALINSHVFSAAAMSTCCMEPLTTMVVGGIAWADQLRSMGYPGATEDGHAFWREMSLAENAARIDTPLLMQLSDNEFRLALEAYAALREQGKPVEMYVYPDEFHTKDQPIHRQAVYRRNLDWFSFWLQHREDPDPAKKAQYARWGAMRAALHESGQGSAPPG
jgi:dipeptidyl aminopeptidase/acylaminoacyl peptidase